LLLPLVVIPGQPFEEAAAARRNLQVALERAVTARIGVAPPAGIVATTLKRAKKWRYGTVAVRSAPTAEGSPSSFLFVARKRHRRWTVAIEGSSIFNEVVKRTPEKLIPGEVRALFSDVFAQGDGSAMLGLPWKTGQSWLMGGGPHNSAGNNTRPRSSLDFSAPSGVPKNVRAAADGIAFVSCQNYVQITHAGGWQTGYYHLTDTRATWLGRVTSKSPDSTVRTIAAVNPVRLSTIADEPIGASLSFINRW
jgi:LasA protease